MDNLWIIYNIVESYQQGVVDNICIVDGIQIFKVRVNSKLVMFKLEYTLRLPRQARHKICGYIIIYIVLVK